MSILPIIDLSLARESRGEVRETLLRALKTSGFFYLTGIPGYDSDELLNLTKWFFNLPEDTKFSMAKKMFNKKSNYFYRGYFPVQPDEISHKEGFEIGQSVNERSHEATFSKERNILEETNQWPRTENAKEDQFFEERMNYFYKIFTETGIELMRLLAESWQLESGALTQYFAPRNLSTFRLLHYPPRRGTPPKEAVDGDYVLQCSEHKDSGFFTLLSTFDYEGLQIRDPNDAWVDVPVVQGCLVVNIGELLATISGGVLKATNHRVIDKGEDRYSCPFFLEPNFNANVNIRLPKIDDLSSDQKATIQSCNDDVITYGLWVIDRMKQFAEFKDLLCE